MTISRFAFLAGMLAASLAFSSGAGAQETVKIGAAVSLSGNFAPQGNLLKNGYAYWEKLVNEVGGIDFAGKKTKGEVICFDDANKPHSSEPLTPSSATWDHDK